MPRPTKPPARSSPTKARKSREEVQQEFSVLAEEAATAREDADPKMDQANRAHQAEVRASVEAVTVETVVQGISALSLDVSKALNGLSAKLLEQVELLGSVREAVQIEQGELERLHKIDVGATAFDQMVIDYQREKQRLEQEIAAQREEWAESRQRTEREQKEVEDNLKKQRQRETDDYEYKKALERKRAQDKYDEEQRTLEKKNQERQEKLEKDWAAREKQLKEAEQELARLRQESADFPVRLEKDQTKAANDAKQEAQRNYDQTIALLKKDADADRKLAEVQGRNLQDTVDRQIARIEALESQLQLAKQQVQDIAVKAIEGASDTKALTHVNKIAIEQAKNRE